MNPNPGFTDEELLGSAGEGASTPDPRLELQEGTAPLLSASTAQKPASAPDDFLEAELLSDDTPEVQAQEPKPLKPETATEKPDPFDIPLREAMPDMGEGKLGEMAQADPITTGDEKYFEEFLAGGTKLSDAQFQDSEIERAASNDPKPWYETAQGFDPEIKTFGGLTTGNEATAMSQAFPQGADLGAEDPVKNLGYSLERGWKMAQKSFSFTAGAAGLPGQIDVQVDLQKDIDQLPRDVSSRKLEAAINSEEPWQAVKELARSEGVQGMVALGAESVLNLGTESGAMFLPGTLALGLTRMPGPAAAFLNSLALEYSSSFMDGMRGAGVDVTDPDAIEKALQDPEFVSRLRQASWAKSIPVAAFDAITLGFGGKLAKGIYKNVIKRIGRNSLGRVTGYTAAGAGVIPPAMATGMTGEILGQASRQGVIAAQKGEEITAETLMPEDKFSVLAEGIGEIGGPLTGSLAFETLPGLKREVSKPAIGPMTEYLRQSGAPQTAAALEQSSQASPVDPQKTSEAMGELAGRASIASAYAGRTDPYPETQPEAETEEAPVMPFKFSGEEAGLTDFSRLSSLIDSIISERKNEKRPAEQTETKTQPTPETSQAQGEAKSTAKEGEPKPDQQGDEASQTSLEEPAAAPEVFKYDQAVDYIADWYLNKRRPELLREGMMEEKMLFPNEMTLEKFASESFMILNAAGIETPTTREDALQMFAEIHKRVKAKFNYEDVEPTGGGGEPPEPDKPADITSKMSAVDFLGSAIQNLTKDDGSKPPKLKKLSGKNVSGEITIPQESQAYVDLINAMPEAPGEQDALAKAESYFRSKVSSLIRNNPKLASLDLSRVQNAARLRLQRQIRRKYQQLLRRGSLSESVAAEKFVSDVLPRIKPSRIFRSVLADYGRKLARRSNAKVGIESTVSLDKTFSEEGDLTFGDILEDKSDNEQDEQVFADIGRNARNAYFNSIQGDLAKNLLFRSAMNMRPGSDISADAGRLRKIQDALEAAGEKVEFDKLQKLAISLMQEFREKVSAKANADYERYQSTGQLPDLVAGPESLKYLTSGRETVSVPVNREDRETHALVDDMLEQLLGQGMITEQQAVAIQDILDENPKKTGAVAAMRELREMLAASAVTANVREPVTRVVSNNPEINDQVPDSYILMKVQRDGASMIYNAYLRGRKGVLLADTAGLGKTRTALAAARMVADHVAKQVSSLTGEELKPGKIIYITESRELIDSAAGGAKAQLVAGNIPSDRVYFKTYDDYSKGKINFEDADVIIFDEAQNLKNPESERARLSKIGNAFHIYVTATPADKIRAVRYFLPRITGRPTQEVENSLEIAKDKPEVIASYLELAGENFAYIRREPVRGLPPANLVEVNLPEALVENLAQIEAFHQEKLDSLSERMLSGAITEDQANNERLGILADRKRSLERYLEMNKTEEVYTRTKEALDSGRQVLIFGEAVNPTSFPELGVNEPVASALEMLKARFEAEGIGVSVIYGEGGEAMVADINDFQKGKKTVALATPNKAGAGLNLDDQTGERPRTVINMTINEAADKDEQMRSRAGGRLSSKSDVEYLEIYAPQAATDRARKDLREKKQRILKVTQGADPGTRDPNQMLLEFQSVIETNKRPVLSMPDVDPTLTPVYSDTAKTRERLNRQMVDDRLNTLRSLQRNAVQRFAQALDELGFRGMRIEFAEYSGKAAWTDWTRGSFNTIYVNPANLATSLDVVASNENGLGELFLRAVGLEEVHHNQVYELIEKVSKNIFAKAIEEGSVSVKEAFRQTYTVMLRGVYSEMSQAMRTEIQSRYKTGKAMSPEMTAIEFLRSVYQELKLEYTTEDFNTEERRRAIARKLQGVPKDGMIRMWLELLRQSVLTLLRKAQKTFAQAPILSNMLDATDNMIQYLTDNGPPFTFTDAFAGSLVPQLRAALQMDSGLSGVVTDTEGNPIQLKKTEVEKLAEKISTEVAKPMAAIDGVLMSGKPSSTRGLSEKVYQGQYAWVKADKLQASHLTNFAPNPKYPFLNTRDYSSSQGDQDKVLEGARNFQPEMFVTNSQSANGGLQTVMRGRRSGDFYVAAGNGRHLISQIATAKAETGRNNLRDMVDRMVELANKEGIPVPENVYEFRLVKVLDMEVDESDKGAKGEIEEIISDLNDGGGRQVSALGKSEQDLPAILGNANLKERLEKFAIGERELTSNTASEFVREAVSLKAVNQLERGYLAEPAEKMSALAYVRYLLARAYSSPNIPLVVAGKNPQVVYATEVMALNDSNWAIVSGLLRTNALSEALGPKGKALRSAIDQLIYRLVTQPDETKSDFLGLLKSFRDRPDELMTLMGTEEEIETQRKMEQIGDLLETQLAKQVSRKTGKTKIDVAKSRARMLRLIRAMGDHLYSTYKEKKEDQKGSMSLDLGDAVEDGVEYMLQVVKARIASNPAVFDQEDGDEDYDPAAASEIESDDFEQPATSDSDPDSEESRSLVDPVMSDEEMRPEKMVWQAWQAEGDIDFGFKSRTAYNRLLTYLDQAGYGKYLRFKKILNSMATDEAWVEEMGKRLDEEAEFKDLLEKATGKTVTSRMERLKMAIPTKEETFEVMRLTNVYAKDGRVAQLLEPIDKAIQYPLVSWAVSRAQDEAVRMLAQAQKEVERLVKAKEYRILRENPRFAEETKAILEEINEGYQKFLSEKVSLADIETTTESEAREKEESQKRVAKRKISEAKLPDKFSPIRLQAAIEQINRNAIRRAVATPSINDRIKGVLKSLEEVGQNLNSLSTSRETATLALLRMIEVSGGKPDFLAKKRINKNIKALEREINRHQVIEKRLLFVLEELEGIKDLSKIGVEEKVDEGKRLTKAQLEVLPQRVQKDMVKRKFKDDFPVYEGTLRWQDPRVGKGTVTARTLSQVISKTGNTTQFNTVIVSYLTESGEVPLATYANGTPIGREDGKALASAYYAQGGKSIIATPQIAGEAPSLSRIEPVGVFLRGDKFYTPAPEPAAPKPKVKILELPMAQRFSKDEPEVNDRGERWYEFTLDPENKRSHQRVYVRATDHLEAIRKAIAKMTEKGQTVLYKGKHYSQREPERTIRVPVNEGRPETIAGLTQDELAIRKAIRMADVARMRELIESGKARDEDYRWFAKQEAEATITGLYEEGRELEDSQVISLAKEFGLIDLSGNRKPDFRRLKQLRELALSRNTPKTMGVSRNVGRSGVIKDVSVNMALFGNQSSTKEVPAPEQTYKLPELPRKTSQDVLQEIADQNGTTVEDIKRVNNMSGAALAPGASLLIPGTTRSVKVPDYNLVQEGPSLFKIAKKFGITREELAKANNLPEDYILKPGDELVIPATKFRDTTKELVDRLFKERVYEAGPTMLRVNTPPPGIRIVNQDGEPAAATTIEPDEARKIELLTKAELPLYVKSEVAEGSKTKKSFGEINARLQSLFTANRFSRGTASLPLTQKIQNSVVALAGKYGRKVTFTTSEKLAIEGDQTIQYASAMSKLQRIFKGKPVNKAILQSVHENETNIPWLDIKNNKWSLAEWAQKTWKRRTDLSLGDIKTDDLKIKWEREWNSMLETLLKNQDEKTSEAEEDILHQVFAWIRDEVLGGEAPNKKAISDKRLVFDPKNQKQREITAWYINERRKNTKREWKMNVDVNLINAYSLRNSDAFIDEQTGGDIEFLAPFLLEQVTSILEESLKEKRMKGYVLPFRRLVMFSALDEFYKNPQLVNLKKTYERKLTEHAISKADTEIDMGEGKKWVYVGNELESPDVEKSVKTIQELSAKGWCTKSEYQTRSFLQDGMSFWFYIDSGKTLLTMRVYQRPNGKQTVVEVEDERNEGLEVISLEHRRLLEDLRKRKGYESQFVIDDFPADATETERINEGIAQDREEEYEELTDYLKEAINFFTYTLPYENFFADPVYIDGKFRKNYIFSNVLEKAIQVITEIQIKNNRNEDLDQNTIDEIKQLEKQYERFRANVDSVPVEAMYAFTKIMEYLEKYGPDTEQEEDDKTIIERWKRQNPVMPGMENLDLDGSITLYEEFSILKWKDQFPDMTYEDFVSLRQPPMASLNGDNLEAFYRPETDEMVFVLDNIKSEARAKELFFHEATHGNVAKLKTTEAGKEELKKILAGSKELLVKAMEENIVSSGFASMEEFRDTYKFRDETEMLGEMLARYAEVLANKEKPGWFQELLAKISTWLKTHFGLSLNDKELTSWLSGLMDRQVKGKTLDEKAESYLASYSGKGLWREEQPVQTHTYTLRIGGYREEITEAKNRKQAIGKNLYKMFSKYGSVIYNGRRYLPKQLGLLTTLVNNNRGWADPVKRIDYNGDGSINTPAAASEIEPSGEEAERIYRARKMSQKKEGKQKVRGFVKTYGNDGEIDRDLRDAAALSSIRYHVRTQPLRAEEAMDLIRKGGGAVAVARELIAPETDNLEIAAISNNPIEFDNLVILNTILIKQLDKTHKAAKALGNNATAAEAMNLSLQLVGKQAVLGTRLGRGLAAFAAYSRLSPAGWRYFLTQQFEQARLEQINLLPEQFQKIATGANASVAEAFEKVINKPEIRALLDKIDELANTKVWEDLLKRAKRVNRIAREAKGKDEAKRAQELDKIIADTKEILAMVKRQNDDRSVLQRESALSEGIAAALMRGIKSPDETAQKLGVSKEEVLENMEPAQDTLDEVRQESTDTLREILPAELRNKPMNWLFDNEEPAAASTPEESIEDGDSVEDELAEADELQADKMLKKFLKDFGKSLRDRDKTESLPQEKVNAIVRRILRENMQKANPELSLKRSKMSAKDRQTRAFTRFRKALSIWKELGEASGDSAFVESVTTALNKMLPPGQAEVVLAALEEALEQPYTKADLKAFLTIKNSNIRDFLFSRRYQLYELQAEIIDTLATELAANGLSVDPELLSNVLQAIAKDLETTAQEELLKTFKQKEYARLPKLKVFQESTNELVRLALLQKLDPTSLFETLAKKLNLDEKSWSPSGQVLEKIQQKAEMVANDPDGPNSRRAIQNTLELLDIIRKEVGFNLLDVTQAFFYANIIGGIKTVGTNIFAPVMNAIHFGFTAASGKARRQGLSYAMQRIRQAFNQGLAEFLSVMATGNIAGKVTFLESMTGTVGQRKTGKQIMELFLEDDARFYSRLPAFGWLVPLAKFWYGIGKETPKLSLQIGLPKSIWDKAFSILKTKPVKKLLGNVRTPQYPGSGVKVHVSIAGLGVLIGRLYSGLDVFWTAVYSEIQAAITAHEIAYERGRIAARAEGTNAPEGSATMGLELENIRITADALMGYDMGSKLRAARLITRNKTAENTEGRDVPEYNELAQQLRAQAEEERLEGLRRGTLEYRQQFYLNRIRNRVYSDQLPEERDIRERMKRRDKLSEKEKAVLDKAVQARNEKVNRLVWESLFMGQWMAQVNEPYGLIGKASKLMENIVKRQGFRLLAFVQPFFSIVANVYTIWLNWMGFGYLKNAGQLGKNIEVYGESKKEKPEALREYEKSAGVVGGLILVFGALMMVAIRHFGDDDEDEEGKKKEPWFSISGRGPEDINQRKALEATGKWQRDSFKFGNTWIKNPVYSPTYLVFKALGDIGDYLKYDVPTHSGLLDLGMGFVAKFIGAAVRGPLDVPFVSGLKTAMDAVNTENPNWISSAGGLLSRTAGGVLVPGIARELDQRVIDPTVRQKSGGLLATLLGNLPFMRSFNKPMTNVFGEPVKFNNPPQGSPVNALLNYLEIFMTQRAEVDPLFEVLMAKQAWITLPPNRVSVLGVVLNEDLADEWKMKRAEYLREEFRREDAVLELWEMGPAEAQAYTTAHTQAANRTADAFILEKYPEIEESAGDMMERKAMYGPRGVK